MAEDSEAQWIAGFWRRIGAFSIDMLFLGVSGYGVGIFFEEQFVQLGGWGRLAGFFVALFYFGIFNSKLCRGQTIGKILFDIRVVNGENQTISVLRAYARYSILGVPFFLNESSFANNVDATFWIYPISLIIFGGLFSAAYLYIFNRATRQSLHDLATGTYVVNEASQQSALEAFWQPHFKVVAALFLGAALLPLVFSPVLSSERFDALLKSRDALASHPLLVDVGVSSGTVTTASLDSETVTTSFLSARARVAKERVTDAELAEQLAQTLADTYPNAKDFDLINIELIYGYDIGIASSWTSYTHQFYL